MHTWNTIPRAVPVLQVSTGQTSHTKKNTEPPSNQHDGYTSHMIPGYSSTTASPPPLHYRRMSWKLEKCLPLLLPPSCTMIFECTPELLSSLFILYFKLNYSYTVPRHSYSWLSLTQLPFPMSQDKSRVATTSNTVKKIQPGLPQERFLDCCSQQHWLDGHYTIYHSCG